YAVIEDDAIAHAGTEREHADGMDPGRPGAAELKLGQSRRIGVAIEINGLANGLLNSGTELETVPAGEIRRIPYYARRQFQWAGAAYADAGRLSIGLEFGAQRDHRVLQVADDALAALGKTGGQRNKLGNLFAGTIAGNAEVRTAEIDAQGKLTFNRFAGHFSDHFASNQQKLAPHLRFRVVGLAHRF